MTGTLTDAQDNMLLGNCTIEEALDWLKAFNGSGWRDGDTVWLATHDDGLEPSWARISDIDDDFAFETDR